MEATSPHVAVVPRWFLVSLLLILLLPIASFVLNRSTVHHFILHQLQSQVGIEVSAVRVHLVPKISIEVSDLVVRDDRSSGATLRAPKASLSFSLWPLLNKQLAMLEIRAVEPDIVLRRDGEGRWHGLLVNDKQTHTTSAPSRQKWIVTDFQVIDGSILILDEQARPTTGAVKVGHVQAAFESNRSLTEAILTLTGNSDDGGDFRINGTLTLEKDNSSSASRMAVSPVHFDGTFEFRHFNLAYWFERIGQSLPAISGKDTAWRGNVFAAVRLHLLQGAQGFDVTVSDLETKLDWLVVRGQGIVRNAGTNHPAYALTLSTSAVDSEILFEYLPSSWIPMKVHAAVVDHELRGTIELVSLALRGLINAPDHDPPEWQVVVKLTNGSGVRGTGRTLIQNLSATASGDPKRAELTDLAGDISGVHLTSSRLVVSDLDLRPTLDAHVAGVGKSEHVLAMLQQFGGDTAGAPILRSLADPTGRLNLSVHLAGPIIPKPSLRLISAEVIGQDLGVRLPGNLSVTQVNGSILADSSFLGIKHVRGEVEGIHFEAEGGVEIEPVARVDKLTVQVSSDGTRIQQFLSAHLSVPPNVLIEGPAHATLHLSGTVHLARCGGRIDMTGTEIIVPPIAHKKRGVPGILEFEGSIIEGKRVILERAVLLLPDSHIDAGAAIELGRTPKFHLQMRAGPVSLRALADLGVMIPVTDGILEASAVVNGEGTNWKLWAPSGWVSMRNGVVTLPGLQEKVSEVSGRLQITARDALLREFSLRIGDSDVRVTGMVEHWRSHPQATFMVESSQLDVGGLLPRKAGNPAKTSGSLQEWMQSKQATITFLINQLRYERLLLKTVSGEITVDQRKAKLIGLRGETPGGLLSGRIEAALGPRKRMDLDAEVLVDGIPTEQLLSAREDETEPLYGNLSMNGVMQATVNADTPIQNTLSTAGHGLNIKVTSGRLHQDPVVTKILKILNIPAMLRGQIDLDREGIPFDSLSARVVARDGLLTSKDIVLDSPIIKVTGAGTADIVGNELDLALAVSPLAAYSDLIGKMPLFGPLLGGDRPGLSTALFEAKGSLRDPDVHYLPLESLGKGLTGYPRLAIDVLVNTITLPQTVLAHSAQ